MPFTTYYEIETTGGRSLVIAGSRVLTHIAGKNYFQKQVPDLSPGEQVLFLNQHIDRKLGEIEPFFDQSPRYRQAEEALFLRNSRGEKIPAFRAELIRGLNNVMPERQRSENLESRILRDGADFTQQEYRAMQQFLHQQLKQISTEEPDLPMRTEAGIRQWLEGETLAPADWNLFYALARITNSKALEEMFSPLQQPSYQNHYRLYTTVRRGIMSWLARKKGNGITGITTADMGNTRPNNGNGDHISLSLEMKIVMGEFFQEVTADYSTARLLSIKEHHEPIAQLKERETRDPRSRLHKGIYAGTKVPEGVETASLYALSQENEVFLELMGNIVFQYFSITRDGKETYGKQAVKFPEGNMEAGSFKILITAYTCGKTVSSPFIEKAVAARFSSGIDSKLAQFANEFYAAMLSGKADGVLGLEEGTIYHLHEVVTNIMRAIPKLFYETLNEESSFRTAELDISGIFDRKQVREKRLSWQDKKKRLRRRYGFEPEKSKSLISRHLGRGLNRFNRDIMMRVSEIMDSPSVIERYTAMFANDYLTRQEVDKMLGEYGLEKLMPFIHPNNFHYDMEQPSQSTAAAPIR